MGRLLGVSILLISAQVSFNFAMVGAMPQPDNIELCSTAWFDRSVDNIAADHNWFFGIMGDNTNLTGQYGAGGICGILEAVLCLVVVIVLVCWCIRERKSRSHPVTVL